MKQKDWHGAALSFAAVLVLVCFAVLSHARKPQKPVSDGVTWTRVGTVSGVTGNYTPVVLTATGIAVFGNSDGVTDGVLYRRDGTWKAVGAASAVLQIADPRDQWIRTSAIARGASGVYYAVLYTGDGYPTLGGYSPSWATSPDGYSWTWHGPITIFGRNQSSAAALIVDEARTDAHRFMAWLDFGGGLYMMHSADGVAWSGDGVNVWPIAGEQPQFCTAAKDSYGYHLICAKDFPATALRHAWSCDGLRWSIIESASDVINTTAGKGANLVFDPATGLLHALTSGTHWQIAQKAYPCP